jgi:hypothetical protein
LRTLSLFLGSIESLWQRGKSGKQLTDNPKLDPSIFFLFGFGPMQQAWTRLPRQPFHEGRKFPSKK